MEQRAVGTGLDVVDCTRLKIDVERARNILARTGLGEKRREAAIAVGLRVLRGATVGLVTRTMSVLEGMEGEKVAYVQPVLERVKFPCALFRADL